MRKRKVKHGSTASDGTGVWIYGLHAGLAAIANPRRGIQRVLLADSSPGLGQRIAAAGERAELSRPPPEPCSRRDLETVLPAGAVHQGLAVLSTPLAEVAIEDLCRAAEADPAATVAVLDQATDPRNVGAVLRSAAAFGLIGLVMQERHAPEATGVLAKAASGALEAVPLVQVTNLVRALETLKRSGFWCVGLDGDAPQGIAEADLSGRVALVLGSEGSGLRRLVREHCDLLVRIPIAEAMGSLNLAAAAAIAFHERARRR